MKSSRIQRFLLMIFFGALWIAPSVWSQDKGIGLGLIVGEPTGISAKLWIADGSVTVGRAKWGANPGPAHSRRLGAEMPRQVKQNAALQSGKTLQTRQRPGFC